MNTNWNSIEKGRKLLVIGAMVSTLLAGCGGGGGGGSGNNPTPASLSGTAASGLPIASTAVSIKDKNGNSRSATTKADGTYTVDVTNMTAPFLLQVPNPAGGKLYSVATASGTANIHPLTDMIVRNWYKVKGSNVDTAFAATGAMPTPPTATDVATIEGVVRQVLAPYMTGASVDSTGFNLITTPFNANHAGFDLVLDNLTVTQPTTGCTSNCTVTIGLAGGGTTSTILSVPDTIPLSTITPPPAPVSDTVAPTTPGSITATRTSATQVVLSWGASSDTQLAGYKIFLNGTQVGITDQPFYIDGAAPSTSACYTVAAFDAAGNKSGQNTQVCATATAVAADGTPPSAPGSLVAVASSSSQIDLSWTASTDAGGIAGYRVMVGGSAIATLPATATAYSHTGLNASTQYSYTVVAIDTSGNATSSVAASATTSAKTDTTAPTTPAGLTATAASSTQLNLAWTASTDAVGVAGYKVYVGNTLIGTSATASFSALNLTASTQYCYTVKAYDAAGNISSATAQVCATTPAASASPAASMQTTLNTFTSFWATTLPSSTDSSLLALFGSTFLEDGQSLSLWLPGMATDTTLIGFSAINLAVDSIDATGTIAQVHFTPVNSAGLNLATDQPGGVVHWQMRLNTAGVWQIYGNQKIVKVAVRSFAEQSTCGVQALQCNPTTTPNSYATGLFFDIGQTSSQPIGTIVVTGPGLPLNGISMVLGINGWSINVTNTTGCADAWPWEWCLTDTEILNASAGSTYTFKFYDASLVLLGTNTEVLAAAAALNTALSTLTYPTLTNLPDISAGITSATLTPTWTIPTGKMADGVGTYIWQSSTGISANTFWYGLWNNPASTGTASIAVPPPPNPGVWDSAVWDITSHDTNNAMFRTHYK